VEQADAIEHQYYATVVGETLITERDGLPDVSGRAVRAARRHAERTAPERAVSGQAIAAAPG
jgi:hypothetical protein